MKFLLLITAIITPALAVVSGIMSVDCNGHIFTLEEVTGAANTALAHLNAGTQVGRNDYPHQYRNLEGFTFNWGCKAPYYEFPILKTHAFEGGSPGPDRVVIGSWDGTDAALCGGITHYGATGNKFLQCSDS